MVGRNSGQEAALLKVKSDVRDARATLSRKEQERARLTFTPATDASVRAAELAAEAATSSRTAECTRRGPNCREREVAERTALAELITAQANKAATDRASAIDAEIARLRARIEKAGPILEANAQGLAFARLFRLPSSFAETLATWQNFLLALVAELLIVASFVASEVLREPKLRLAAKTAETGPVPIADIVAPEPQAARLEAPKPRIVSDRSSEIGSVTVIMADLIESNAGKIELAEAFVAYRRECRAKNKQPVSIERFGVDLRRMCQLTNVPIQSVGEHVYLMGVTLKQAAA